MIRRTLTITVALLSSTALVAACSGKGGGSGPSSSSTPAASSPVTSLPYAGAPKVQNPLPVSVLSTDPCAALTSEQVQAAIVVDVPGKRGDLAGLGADCSWSNLPTGAKVALTYDTETHTGLSGVYQNTQPKTKAWKEMPQVLGFPAVAHDFTPGDCQVSVGLADDLSIDVSAFLSSRKTATADPCEAASKVAGLMITTLRQKAGA
ncbi:DUF3558 domain-containing protein [Amycolatopsis sp. H20-H5]|uniref:DUF3558 domain-containing protein n=1 Tax=Amycolatopsis sp. H20-H5 TaxID=3046309 RepID=UPI002DBFCB14|nr:DUF3558 domain-containing protein [Amycolatopsis sp. H20-H5]MEC3974295.1 DUF3558 domain-containing protein [Amycolatopsis sp. H20-H5]